MRDRNLRLLELTQRQDRKRDAHSPVLEDYEEEASEHENAPDDDIRQDTCGQIASVDSSGTVPEDGDVVPCIRRTDDWPVNPQGGLGVAEVERGQVEQIGDQDDLAGPEVAADPAHDEAELHKIVLENVSVAGAFSKGSGTSSYENVVAANIGAAVEILGI
jgi:hypothetical protein